MSEPARQELAPIRSAEVIQAPASLMDALIRAASDPNVDVDKLERLGAIVERINAQEAKAEFARALAKMQPTLPVIDRRGCIEVPAKDGKSGHSTPFARWEDINDAIRPMLSKHGFALSFRLGQAADGKITVTGVLSHRDGHQEETTITLAHDSTGSKNAAQAVGSSTSYGKRYTAMALLNITSRAPGERDDDGHNADPSHWCSEVQVSDLTALMDEVKADRTKFLNFLRVDTLAHLPASRFQEAVRSLEAKRKAR